MRIKIARNALGHRGLAIGKLGVNRNGLYWNHRRYWITWHDGLSINSPFFLFEAKLTVTLDFRRL